LGLLSLDRALVEPYLEGLSMAGLDSSQARMGGLLEVYVTDDPDRTWQQIAPFVAYRWESYNRHMLQGTSREGSSAGHFDDRATRSNFILGPADFVADEIRRRTAGMPVSDVYAWTDFSGLSDVEIERHIELLVTEVAPRLRD
jgi:hypothetical protein